MTTVTRTTTTITRASTETPRRTTPARGWLLTLGWLLLAFAILGLIPFMQDLAHDFGVHIEAGQDLLHWALGIGALVAAYALRNQLWLAATTIAFGAVLIVIGFIGLVNSSVGYWHAGVGDSVAHLLLGTITLLVGIVSLNRERDYERRNVNVVRTT